MADQQSNMEVDQVGIGLRTFRGAIDLRVKSNRGSYVRCRPQSKARQAKRILALLLGSLCVSPALDSFIVASAQDPPTFVLPPSLPTPELIATPPAEQYSSPTTGLISENPSLQPSNDKPAVVPYWVPALQVALRSPPDRTARAKLEDLIWEAIAHSPHVQAVLTVPKIRETEIQQAKGAFDPSRFANSIWNDRSDPVGNTLTTGGAARLNEHLLQNSVGIRNKNRLGGNLEASQSVDLRDNNSLFFVPKQQADTKMLLRYTQPLMRGSGRAYNLSSIGIAECQVGIATHDAQQALQAHVLDITQAYWKLYFNRAQLIQLQRGLARLQGIADELQNRSDLDVVPNLHARARAHVKTLQSQHTRAMASVIQAESLLRAKVNASWIDYPVCDEIITECEPLAVPYPIDVEAQLDTALETRPDLLAIRDEIKAARIRLCVAENELKPTLNLVTDLYVRGLDANYDYGQAIGDQFVRGAPSYSGGIEFVRPKNQTVAKAIRRQRHLEIQQLLFSLNDKLLSAAAEIRSEIAEVDAAYMELKALEDSAIATKEEVEYTVDRWRSNAILEPTQISVTLDQLLEAEIRLVRAENNWSSAQAEYMIAIAKLQYSTGSLLSATSSLEPTETGDRGSTQGDFSAPATPPGQ